MSTFVPTEIDPLLLIAVLLLGATYGEKDAHQLAICIHDNVRPQIFANAGFCAKPDLWMLQAILLLECFGKSRAGQKQHEMSHLFHGLLINIIRRSDCQTIQTPTPEDGTGDQEDDWRTWCDAEQKKRLAFLCFMWDTQHAVLFCQSLCMSAFELRSNLPCDQSLWEANSAETWQQLRHLKPTTPRFLSCLKMYLHPNTAKVPRNLNFFSRSLLLHGLMSVAWDMQRRDQTSLGVIENNPLGNWQTRLEVSYKAWHKDYEVFYSQYLARLPSPDHYLARELQVVRAATLALFHSACILLHTPFLDLQIYAGARHILGRPVVRHDYTRSQRVAKKWVTENPIEAGKAVWHAAALVADGVDILDGEPDCNDTSSGRLWHHPWSIYLGAIVIWGVWYARSVSVAPDQARLHENNDNDEDEIIWDPKAEMKALLDTVTNSNPDKSLEMGGIACMLGKKGTNGLAVVVSRCLSKVRWAVVYDGMMVLRGLVEWRLVGGGGPGVM
ncbi:fungal-specific transcription factor domain-containing protein [Phaeosphaeriaceae sp. PMI808]|nr:fungal-specific transcription factor domain-containing protein [Phaeosphaeriaceae sp. PMI808]